MSARSSSRKAGFVSAVLLFLGISSVALGSWLGVPGQPGERSAALAQDPVESQGELYLWFGAVPLEEGETAIRNAFSVINRTSNIDPFSDTAGNGVLSL